MSLQSTRVRAAMAGNTHAYGELAQSCQSMVLSILIARIGPRSAVEDVAQEVLTEAWRKLHQLRNPDSFLPWLRQLTRNRATDWLRAQGRSREVADDDAVARAIDPSIDPDAADDIRFVQDCLEALSTDDREILVLFHLEERSSKQVATLLGLSDAATRKRLSRARGSLREEAESRLDVHLNRCAAGFVFSLPAGIGSTPSLSAKRTRRGVQAMAAVLCVAGLATLMLPRCGAQTTAEGPRPSESVRGLATLAQRGAVPPIVHGPDAGAEEPPPSPEHTIKVRLGTTGVAVGSVHTIRMFQPAAFWPRPDEVDWPTDRASALVLQLAGDIQTPLADEQERWLQQFSEARTASDPWTAVLQAEAGRNLAERQWLAEMSHWEEGTPTPRQSGDVVMAHASEIIERWPDHPVADYAMLYELDVLAEYSKHPDDAALATQEALAILRGSTDPLVQDEALMLLANVRSPVAHTPEDLDLLLEFAMHLPTASFRHALGVYGTEAAIRLGDLQRGERWLRFEDRSTEDLCAERGNERPCASAIEARDNRSSWLAVHGHSAPLNWRAALSAAARTCGAEVGLAQQAVQSGTWSSDAWDWTTVGGPEALAACLRDNTPQVDPPDETVVSVEVYPRRTTSP